MIHFTISVLLLCVVGGRSFRLDASLIDKFKSLKAVRQDAHEIAGESEHEPHNYYGDVSHSAASGPMLNDTANVLQQELANGLRKDFNFLRDALTVFSGPDGFVREGIVFCNPNSLTDSVLTSGGVVTVPSGYHSRTVSSTPNDGFGDLLSASQEKLLCGTKNCEEGSFVNILSNRIRSLGYHSTHEDICSASVPIALSSEVVPQARTCNLQRNLNERKVRACKKEAYDVERDFFQMNEKCYQVNDQTECELIVDSLDEKMCTFDIYEKLCHVSYDYIKSNMSVLCPKDKTVEDIASESSDIKNEIRRAMAYSVKTHGPVITTDKMYVTGVTDGHGCRSLRQYVAAINGMAQINAFRDTGIIEAENYWQESIREVRSYIDAYADVLKDFYDMSTQIFPLIEFEDVQECEVGDVEINKYNLGVEIAPLCDDTHFDSRTVMNRMSFEAQSLIRSKCFCRMGQLSSDNGREKARCSTGTPVYDDNVQYASDDQSDTDYDDDDYDEPTVTSCMSTCSSGDLNATGDGCVLVDATFTLGVFVTEETNVVDAAELYEADDIYLMYNDAKLRSKCNDIKSLESHYHYCISSFTESRHWQNVLSDLEPNLAQIKHYRSSIDPQDIIDQIRSTMPLVSDEYNPSCGRLVSASIEDDLHSNKGGNCVPFDKFNEVLYRLEYETSKMKSGKIRGSSFTKFQDGLCKIENKLENTHFTFRQMAYQWDHAMRKSHAARVRSKPVLKNEVSVWENYKTEQKHDAINVNDRLYWSDQKTIPMCFVDWVHEITGDGTVYDAAGTVYDDPYSLFGREIEEAIFNTQVARQTKLETKTEHELLWAALEEELTSIDNNRLNYQLARGIAKHFMRIYTTDSGDKAVDGSDLHAEDAASELPVSDATGSS